MAEESPSAYGLAITWCRSKRGWTKKRLASALGLTDDSQLARYEKGDKKLTRDYAESILECLGFPPEVLDVHEFTYGLICPEPPQDDALSPEELRQIDLAALRVGWTVAAAVRKELIRRMRSEMAEVARRHAEDLWLRLQAATRKEREELIESFPESWSPALAVRVCEASVKAAAHKAGEALELAELALSIARRVPDEEGRSRVEGYSWAYIANARRVGNDFDGADEAFTRAWDLWRASAEAEAGLAPEWRMLSLEASLRREQHRFPESLDLLDRARVAVGDDPVAVARILLQKENAFEAMGHTEGALAALAEAVSFVEASGDLDLHWRLRFKITNNLCHLEHYEEASARLPQVRELAERQGNALDLIRVVWLGARIAAGQGQTEDAIAGLEQVRRAFADHDLPYDAALASLDLAVLWLKAGRTTEVRELATKMEAIFKTRKIHREALAALLLFCEAARRETATVDLARRTMAEVERVRHSAPRRIERPR